MEIYIGDNDFHIENEIDFNNYKSINSKLNINIIDKLILKYIKQLEFMNEKYITTNDDNITLIFEFNSY